MNKKRIMLLEDDDDIRELVTYILESAGYDVVSNASVNEFNSTLTQINRPDGFLLDVMLPDGNGLQLCQDLKSNASLNTIPVIMMSAHEQQQIVAEKCDAEMFIAKPFDIQDFVSRIGAIV